MIAPIRRSKEGRPRHVGAAFFVVTVLGAHAVPCRGSQTNDLTQGEQGFLVPFPPGLGLRQQWSRYGYHSDEWVMITLRNYVV